MSKSNFLVIDPTDNVGVSIEAIPEGIALTEGVRSIQAIPAGHKVAIAPIKVGQKVQKYGAVIGMASQDIPIGAHVHTHNLVTTLGGPQDYLYKPASLSGPGAERTKHGFMGYRRANGMVGTRNEIWVLCTVGCVARTAQRIAAQADMVFQGRVDGVYAFSHPFGCSQVGEDLSATRDLIAALAKHPNAGGVLIVGLGCENNQLSELLEQMPDRDQSRLRTLSAQSLDDEIDAGLQAVAELVDIAEHDHRELCSLKDLTIGVKCGGSDAFSGLTANPLVGQVADRVYDNGGRVILSEIPEVFGGEVQLMERASDQSVFSEIVELVNDFKSYFIGHGEPVSDNPSPGNITGGITTLEEKSLGAIQKAGRGQIVDVLRYGEQVKESGVTLLESPGNDAVSSTALAAAGASIILFTTGRGTPLGFPSPTLKVSSNADLAQRKAHWIDFDASAMLSKQDATQEADRLLELVIATASGQRTKSEQLGEREIAIWKRGVTL